MVNYLIHKFQFHCMNLFGLATDSHTLSSYVSISIYTHFIGYWHCMWKMYIMSLNAPLILETLQYWWFLKENAILNTVYIAGPYSVFVQLNLAYHLAICELFFLLFSTFMSDYDFYVVFCLHPKVFASQIKIRWL